MYKYAVTGFGLALTIAGFIVLARMLGIPVSGATIGFVVCVVAGLVAFAVRRPKHCPRCTTDLPLLRAPTSFKQGLFGGWTCQNCGCEIDRRGSEIAPKKA